MEFVVIENEGRYILYFHTSTTYEVICATDDKERIISALKKFCLKFNGSRSALEKFMREYKSVNTKTGIIYRIYNQYIEEQWSNFFRAIWKPIIDSAIEGSFLRKPTIRIRPRIRAKVKID